MLTISVKKNNDCPLISLLIWPQKLINYATFYFEGPLNKESKPRDIFLVFTFTTFFCRPYSTKELQARVF